jgi:inorganic pyrophosphatase
MQITMIVEIPQGERFKYEMNKATKRLKLDRPLNQPVPYSYGFIESTLEEDSDPIDIFLLTDLPIYPLTEVQVELLGVLKCKDNGVQDNKLIATLVGDCRGYEEMGIAVIKKYLETYKEGFEILEYCAKDEAEMVYLESVKKCLGYGIDNDQRFDGTEDLDF